MRVQIYHSLEHLPQNYSKLFDDASKGSFYYSLPWFQNLIRTASRPDDQVCLYGAELDQPHEGPLALLVMRSTGRIVSSYSNMYSILFGPVIRASEYDEQTLVGALVEAITSERPAWEIVNLDSLHHDSPVFPGFVNAFRNAGFLVQPYFHFGNWYEETRDSSLDSYLKKRPSVLRNTLKRKSKSLDKSGRARFKLTTDRAGLDAAIRAYETVYETSWKTAEPFPDFTEGLIRSAAAVGALRLGVCYIDEEPAAAQIWLVAGGSATIFKLAYDERFRSLSIGSILTKYIMQHVIEIDRVDQVDFGHGDDPYKKEWLSRRRERWGIMAFNPKSVRGAIGALNHIGRHAAKTTMKRLANKLIGK